MATAQQCSDDQQVSVSTPTFYVTSLDKLFTQFISVAEQYNLVLVKTLWHFTIDKATSAMVWSNGSVSSPAGWLPNA